MAKRKRSSLDITPRKQRTKGSTTSGHPHGKFDPNKEYKLKSIISERKKEYLIRWEDDEETGEGFPDSWEPKANANQEAIDDWEQQKAKKKSAKGAVQAPSPTKPLASHRGRGRPRRIIKSSPPVGGEPEPSNSHESDRQPTDDLLEIGESQQVESNIGLDTDPASPLFEPDTSEDFPAVASGAAVQPSSPPSSYQAGGYHNVSASQTVSDAPSGSERRPSPEPSQYIPNVLDTTETTEGTTQISGVPTASSHPAPTASGQNSSAKVVPDSQSALPSASYFPSAPEVHRPSTANDSSNSSADGAKKVTKARFVDTLKSTSSSKRTEEPQSEYREEVSTGGVSEAQPDVRDEERERQSHSSNHGPDLAASTNGIDQGAIAQQFHSSSLRESQASAGAQNQESQHPSATAFLNAADLSSDQSRSQHNRNQSALSSASARQSPQASQPESVKSAPSEAGQPPAASAPRPSPITDQSRGSTQGPNNAYIDLTGIQDQPTSISRFTVTPPRGATQPTPAFSRNRPTSSAWQSPFAFQTQLSRPPTAGTAAGHSSGPKSPLRTQPSLQAPIQFGQTSIASKSLSQPVGPTSPFFTSSSIPHPPSQSIEAHPVGESAPPRPLTFSGPVRSPSVAGSMDSNLSPAGREVREKIRAMRQQSKLERESGRSGTPNAATPNTSPKKVVLPASNLSGANDSASSVPKRLASPYVSNLDRDRGRSPSAVPAQKPLVAITAEQVNNSGRYETLLPQAQATGGLNSNEQQNGSLFVNEPAAPASLIDDPEVARAHVVPIYFIGHQRDQYPQLAWFYKDTIQRFLASDDPDIALVQEAERFIQRIRHITLHPDLDNPETYTQYDVQPFQQADWDARCSAKFRFLKELIASLPKIDFQVAIVAQSGRIIEMLETFLQGINIAYRRPDALHSPTTQRTSVSIDDTRVILLSSSAEVTCKKTVDLVIAMDNSVKHETPQIRSLRQEGNSWAPFLKLIVPRSVEHVERCLSPALPQAARLRALVSGTYQYRDEAGRAYDPEIPKAMISKLVQYLDPENQDTEWPLPTLDRLADLDSQTDSEYDNNTNAKSVGEKRSREPEDRDMNGVTSSKRSRVGSPHAPPGPSQNLDVTHISDSVENSTQSNLAQKDADINSSEMTATEKRLQELLRGTQNRLEEHVRDLSDLQYRYEEQRAKLLEVTTERDAAISTAQQAVSRLTEDSNRMSTLRAENTVLKEELKEANAKLLDHYVPERAEFEALRLSTAQIQADKEKVDRRLEQANKDVAYVRELYQTSSNSAQTLAAQNTELENQLSVAQNRATGEQAKLRQMSQDDFTTSLRDENKRIKTLLKNHEAGLKSRDEEIAKLKEASRGRMGTRGTSVPRSPRLDSPKPSSRQASPAAGELRGRAGMLHPLRNG